MAADHPPDRHLTAACLDPDDIRLDDELLIMSRDGGPAVLSPDPAEE
ncbi:hypothetical protein AB0D54_33375 [Streptomyces xanthophaeus]